MSDAPEWSDQTASSRLILPTVLAEQPLSPSVIASGSVGWHGIAVEQDHLSANAIEFLTLPSHLITLNLGRSGRLAQVWDGRSYEALMVPGSVTFTPAGQTVRLSWQHQAEVARIYLDPQWIDRVAQVSGRDPSRLELVRRFGQVDLQMQSLGRLLLAEARLAGLAEPLYVESLANLLTIHLLRYYSATAQDLPEATGRWSASRLAQSLDYLHEHLAQRLTVADLASSANLSSAHFSRLFYQELGVTPHQYIIRRRLELARQLLETGNRSVAEVAQQVGFADQGHLTRHFKRWLGVTPSAVLRESRNSPEDGTNLQVSEN